MKNIARYDRFTFQFTLCVVSFHPVANFLPVACFFHLKFCVIVIGCSICIWNTQKKNNNKPKSIFAKKVNIKQLSMFSEASSFDWMLTVKIFEKLKLYFAEHWKWIRWVEAVLTSWKFNSYTKLRQYWHCVGMWEHVFEWLPSERLSQKELAGWYEACSAFVNGSWKIC